WPTWPSTRRRTSRRPSTSWPAARSSSTGSRSSSSTRWCATRSTPTSRQASVRSSTSGSAGGSSHPQVIPATLGCPDREVVTVPESTPLRPADAEALRGLAGGAVHLPGDPLYDEARMPWNLQVDEHPAAVAYPADPQEVARIVKAAAASGLRVAPQGTGHGAPPLAG